MTGPAHRPAKGLLVGVGEEVVLLPLPVVTEVMDLPHLTLLPHAAEHLLGVTAVRGTVLPVWDAAGLLGIRPAGPAQAVVRLLVAGSGLALGVERLDGLRTIVEEVEGPTTWWSTSAALLRADGPQAAAPVPVLDSGALLQRVGP